MANIEDVAKLANVSIATVSRAFNNKPDVSEKTKNRIMEIAKNIGYEPSIPARSLAKGKSNTLGLIVPDITNPFYAEVVRGIEDICHIYNYKVILCNADSSREKELQYIDVLKNYWVDGVIFHSDYFAKEHLDIFTEKNIPVVLAGRPTKYDVAHVAIDNVKAAYDATSYLISLGHERIGLIHGSLNGMKETVDSVDRLNGYKKALKDAGIKYRPELTVEADFKAQGGYRATKELILGGERPTAVFAISDIMAFGAINAVFDSGFSCPENVSVLGFDNIELSAVVRPSLTTVAQPMRDMGAIAARMLIKIVSGETLDNRKIILEHKLIVRKSCQSNMNKTD